MPGSPVPLRLITAASPAVVVTVSAAVFRPSVAWNVIGIVAIAPAANVVADREPSENDAASVPPSVAALSVTVALGPPLTLISMF